jgi:hypothetical protein
MSDDQQDHPRLSRSLAADDAARERRRLGGGRHDLVDNAARRRSPSSLSGQGAVAWLLRSGRRRVLERTGWRLCLVDLSLERWLADVGGNHAALCEIIRSAVFLALVAAGIRRQQQNGPQLQLALISICDVSTVEQDAAGIGKEMSIPREKPGIILFPFARRHTLVTKLVAIVAGASTAVAGENLLSGRLARLERALRRKHMAEQAIATEIATLEEAVRFALLRGVARRGHADG